MMHLIGFVAVVLLNPVVAKSRHTFGISKLGAERNQYEGVLDMDSLMDTHHSQISSKSHSKLISNEISGLKSKPQVKSPLDDLESELVVEAVTSERAYGNMKITQHDLGNKFSSSETAATGIPGVSLEPNTIPPVLRKLFLDHANITKRGFLSNVNLFSNLHKSRERHKVKEKPPSSVGVKNGDNVLAPKPIPPHLQSSDDPKLPHMIPIHKRSDTQRKSQKQIEIKTDQEVRVSNLRNAEEQEKWNWEEWHSIENPKTVQKRDAASRRMKISDIWNKQPKKEISHEDAIKIVLPVLLSELNETRDPRKPILLVNKAAVKPTSTPQVVNNVNGTLPKRISNSTPMKSFRIKTDDGSEFSFTASVNDMHRLLSLLTKADSMLMVEKFGPDQSVFQMKSTKKPPNIAKFGTKRKSPSCLESADVLEMKEIETNVVEDILQVDIPVQKPAPTELTAYDEYLTTSENLPDPD